ncbi:HsdR family type I site-specific deoxyribonuclease [Saccharibacter sp. 17.LH.SD]|uniref:type I restriction endonuclease subunit R n=1 Tax=Saccharibacter sp. 17.LH.SD TaxID=2689393 RepID=UPI001370F98B|nr:type I restriction endonuclease subunit R [Saccharibacter sp. 17.LH.SD]MXV44288.1 HsdR family type I site-specific deoxyribonuclease [Saccharibacter sp. 17.LH.SD]
MAWVSEAELETHFMESLVPLGYRLAQGRDVSPEHRSPLRESFRDAILTSVFSESLKRLNPTFPASALKEAARRVLNTVFTTDILQENRRLHELMVGGVPVTFTSPDEQEERHERVRLVDWTNQANDWLAVRQFDIAGATVRIPDVVLFLNGLPLVVVELKTITGADIKAAWNQIATYKHDIPELFRTNLFTIISDGMQARYGSLSAEFDRYMGWRTVDGHTLVPHGSTLELATLAEGLLAPAIMLDMLRWFTVFEDDGRGLSKKIAGYHQFHAVQKAHSSIMVAQERDGKAGVIWHTQGSGKSLLMAFLSGRVMRDPAMKNPTLLVLTDRNDLDNQLFATFARCKGILGEEPIQIDSIQDLKQTLSRESGGVIFSTIQKFRPDGGEDFPELTDRSNVIVLVDEAHRTQYNLEEKIDRKTGQIKKGLAFHLRRALPHAVYVAFTGTPVELVGADTRGVFGDYIDIYDIAQAVADRATVPIYYESRVVKIDLDEEITAILDDEFSEATEALPEDQVTAKARKWARVEALVGADKRLDMVVADILDHFNARLQAMNGKAMIVCMSRRICVEVYKRIIAAYPEWGGETDDTGCVKVVMTGSATDPQEFKPHIRSKARQEIIRKRFKDAKDPLKLVIVRDMWLTGFDAPCMHTLYVDKPMRGHGLMQAIARVNRVFEDKPAGLVVDYIGIAAELKAALAHYSKTDQDETGIDEGEAVAAFLDALDVSRAQFHGFDYSKALDGTPGERLAILPNALEYLLEKDRESDKETKRFRHAVAALVKGYKLASGNARVREYATEVAFFVAVRSSLDKLDAGGGNRTHDDRDVAIQQLVNKAVTSTEVIDILSVCGIKRPDISVLSEEFLLELQGMKQRNLAVEALKKLLDGQIKARTRTNVVQQEAFSTRLKEAIARYHNRSVTAVQVLQELINLAKDVQNEPQDGYSKEERAFYDALAQNKSAVELMSNQELRVIATKLVLTVRNNAGVDWWKRDDVRAKMRVAIKRILKHYGYPPDMTSNAVKLVLKQAEALAVG